MSEKESVDAARTLSEGGLAAKSSYYYAHKQVRSRSLSGERGAGALP